MASVFFALGLAALSVAFASELSADLETLLVNGGFMGVGAGGFFLAVSLVRGVLNWIVGAIISRDLCKLVYPLQLTPDQERDLPFLIATNISGCVTPGDRSNIDWHKFMLLKAYCQFAASAAGRGRPPLVFFTGRSEGYAELLSEFLGLAGDGGEDHLPLVIENGCALFFPRDRRVEPLVAPQPNAEIERIRDALKSDPRNYTHQFKRFMVTISKEHKGHNATNEYDAIRQVVGSLGLTDAVEVTHTASAVDITPGGYTKRSGIEHVLNLSTRRRFSVDELEKLYNESVVFAANGESNRCVVAGATRAYAPSGDILAQLEPVRESSLRELDFVLDIIEREAQVRFLPTASCLARMAIDFIRRFLCEDPAKQ